MLRPLGQAPNVIQCDSVHGLTCGILLGGLGECVADPVEQVCVVLLPARCEGRPELPVYLLHHIAAKY